jgi:hypothetical protein
MHNDSLSSDSTTTTTTTTTNKKSSKTIIINNNNSNSNDINLSADLTSLLYSFNGLYEQTLFNNINGNLIMRSASSAGETVTKYNTDASINAHLSIPKRAETFNGISKDSQTIDTINLNSDLASKSRGIFKNSIDLSDINPYLLSNNESNNHQQQQQHGSSADLNQDAGSSSNCSSLSIEQLNKSKINKNQLENILRFILSDYMKLKTENQSLLKELEIKNKSIDLLRATMDECKDQLDFEKTSLQKKFNELDKKEQVKLLFKQK